MYSFLIDHDFIFDFYEYFDLERRLTALDEAGVSLNLFSTRPQKREFKERIVELVQVNSEVVLPEDVMELVSEDELSQKVLAVASENDVDIVFTESKKLLGINHKLKHMMNIIITSKSAFWDYINILLVGHGIFLCTELMNPVGCDLYITMFYEKAADYRKLYCKYGHLLPDGDSQNEIRNVLLNRYPYIIYARLLIKFFEINDHEFKRNRDIGSSTLITGYHVNSFYLQLWGMLDHLAKILTTVESFDIHELQTGIFRNKFKKAVKENLPDLYQDLYCSKIGDWLKVLADIRHQAAHNYIHLPTDILAETKESLKSDAEIIEILKNDGGLECLSDDDLKNLLPNMIDDWRISKREKVGSGMIPVKSRGRDFFYPVLNSIDYELEHLNQVIDLLLASIFRKSKSH